MRALFEHSQLLKSTKSIAESGVSMLENHNICDFSVFDHEFLPFNYLSNRDKQVIRQYIQNFSCVINLIRLTKQVPFVLEIGSGLSTIVFSKLLTHPNEKIISLDACFQDAIILNTRGLQKSFQIKKYTNCNIIQGTSIGIDELNAFYSSPSSTLLSMIPENVLAHLDLFFNISLDDRKYHKIAGIIENPFLTPAVLKKYLLKNSLFCNQLMQSYRTQHDEFEFLKNTSCSPMLRSTLIQYQPNIIYLDSGEFSNNLEFNIVTELAPSGSILILQDIFFPKSIKSFLIASSILSSPHWQVLWIDRTTPQGIVICKKR